MNRRYLVILLLFLASCSSNVKMDDSNKITREIGIANHCETDQDCELVKNSKCPFGCYVYVNKNEVNKIEGMLSAYDSNCRYRCVQNRGVECRENKCVVMLT